MPSVKIYTNVEECSIRDPCKDINPETEDFVFQLLDANITFIGSEENVDGVKCSEIYLHGVTESCHTVVVEKKITGGEDYCPYFWLSVPEKDPDDPDRDYKEEVMAALKTYTIGNRKDKFGRPEGLKFKELESVELCDKFPTISYRAGIPMQFLRFRFFTIRSYKEFSKALNEIFPAPTKSDIEKGIYRNDYMVCEAKDVEEMKFADWEDVLFGGWIRLKKGTYDHMSTGVGRAHYNWCATELEWLKEKENVGAVYIDSLDIEAVRHDGQNAMPDPTNPDDVTASIAHVIKRSDRKKDKLRIIWSWVPQECKKYMHIENSNKYIRFIEDGKHKRVVLSLGKYLPSDLAKEMQKKLNLASKKYNQFEVTYDEKAHLFTWRAKLPFELLWEEDTPYQECKMALRTKNGIRSLYTSITSTGEEYPYYRFPKFDKEGKPLDTENIVVMEYDSESDMFNAWSAWWTGVDVSTDVIIGWNILGFDMGWIIQRMDTLCGINEVSYEWGRLNGHKTVKKESSIESKAISYNKYVQTPSPGRLYDDQLIATQRNVTKRYRNYHLNTVAQEELREGKEDVHHSEIKGLFYGGREARGRLFWYNLKDCIVVMKLYDKNARWADFLNNCRTNRVLGNLICPRGQQILVYGGMHYVAFKNNYVVWRPHYHPLLDNPIFDGEEGMENFDNEKLANVWMKMFKEEGIKPKFSLIDADEQGNIKVVELPKLNELVNEEITIIDDFMDEIDGGKTEEDYMDTSNDRKRKAEVDETENNKQARTNEKNVSPKNTVPAAVDKKGVRDCVAGNGISVEKILSMLDSTSKSKRQRKQVSTAQFHVKHSFDNDDGNEYCASVTDIIRSNKSKLSIVEVQSSKNEDEEDEEEDEMMVTGKGFSGGYVMDPIPGWYENVPILDFNSLYPNLMLTHYIDPALMVLDLERFYKPYIGKVKFFEIRFNENTVFYFAQNSPGVMIQHTRNLVNNRKIAQGTMGSFENRLGQQIELLKEWLESKSVNPEDIIDEAENFINGKIINDDPVNLWHLHIQMLENERRNLFEVFKSIRNSEKPPVPLSEDLDVLIDMARDYAYDPKSDPIKKDIVRTSLELIQELILKAQECRAGIKNDEIPNPTTKRPSVIHAALEYVYNFEGQYKNYFSKQNRLKVSGNSTFGFTGAGGAMFSKKTGRLKRTGMMTAKPVSACVTFMGRQSIERAKRIAEEKVPGSKVIYIDTDSIFWDCLLGPGKEALLKSFVLAKELAEEITKDFQERHPGTMKIVHEKTAGVIALYTAKCYALFKHMSPTDPGKLEIKGLSFSKRDACKFANQLGKETLDILLGKRDIEAAKQHVKTKVMELVKKDFARGSELNAALKIHTKAKQAADAAIRSGITDDIEKTTEAFEKADANLRKVKESIKAGYEEIALYKKLNKRTYEGKCVGHAKLAERIDMRNPGLGPKSGDSVKYMYFYKDARDFKVKRKMEDRIEDFDYFIDNNMKIDLLWYLEGQITKTVEKIFSILMKDPKELLYDAIGLQQNKQMGAKSTIDNMDLSDMFEEFVDDDDFVIC